MDFSASDFIVPGGSSHWDYWFACSSLCRVLVKDSQEVAEGDLRKTYVKALKAAEEGNYKSLIAFARS